MQFLNNLPVKKKFIYIVSFMVVISFVIGLTGGIGLRILNLGEKEMYEQRLSPIIQITDIIENLLTASNAFDSAIVSSGNSGEIENYLNLVESLNAQSVVFIKAFEGNRLTDDILPHFNNGKQIFNQVFLPNSSKVFSQLAGGDVKGSAELIRETNVKIGEMVENFNQCKTMLVEQAKMQRAKNVFVTRVVLITLLSILLVGIWGSVFIGNLLSKSIRRPMELLSALSSQVGDKGNLRINAQMEEKLYAIGKRKDEFGRTSLAFVNMFQTLGEKATILEGIAQGDLSVHTALKSDDDTVGISIDIMVKQLNDLISQISFLSEQVSRESQQIADGSQSMAEGSTHQRTVVERLSQSIMDVEKKTKANETMADDAFSLNEKIKTDAEKGSVQMHQMTQAVEEINAASQSIKNVIKVIDDIAFQTNILALNAAVEAARAGQHGKGFAVVADEVRNLAAKSAEAAKDTESLISNSIERAHFGARIANETATSLVGIVAGINESSIIVDKIVKSSHEQSVAISHINAGISQVNTVVQQNSALSEELAAFSVQMSHQSSTLTSLVARFKLSEKISQQSQRGMRL